MKVTHVKLGQLGPMRGQGKCPVTICVEISTTEFLTITVSVPNVGSERDICECGIGKAKDLAKGARDAPKLRPTGLGSGIDKDRADYTVYSAGWDVGRIYEPRDGPDSLRWFWSLTVNGPMTRSARVATRRQGAVSEELGRMEGVGEAGGGRLNDPA